MKTFAIDKEMMGKEFLIQDTLPNLKWKLSQETKQIGDYLCFKATTTQKATKSDLRNFRMRKQEESKEKKPGRSKHKDICTPYHHFTAFIRQSPINLLILSELYRSLLLKSRFSLSK